jgi:3-methyladenine DNA glycosylase AlkD
VDTHALLDALDAELREETTPERAEKERAYLKSDLVFYGANVPRIRHVGKTFLRDHPELTHDELIEIVEGLWREPVHERRMLAVALLERRCTTLRPSDLPLLERLLRESATWALVDGLAISVAGPVLGHDPNATATLDRWAGDDDFWIRRSALLTHLRTLREGGGDFDRFARYADAMLEETEFFIRKAIGWVLRDTARKRPHLVFEWIAPRTDRASGVTIREVVKRLPADQAGLVMAAYREKRPAV